MILVKNLKRNFAAFIIASQSMVLAVNTMAYDHNNAIRSYVKSSDGTQISYLDNRNLEKPAILFVHGFSQSAEAWQLQMQSDIAKNYRMLAIDLRGHGYSGKPEDPNFYVKSQSWADDINAILEQEKLNSVSLVAWSYGGLPLLDYVKAYGDAKINKLIMVATGYMLDLRPEAAGGPKMALGAGVLENTATMAAIPAGPPGADLDGCMKAKTCDNYQRQYDGTKRFLKMVSVMPLNPAISANLLAQNMQTPTFVRRAMIIDRFLKSGPLDHTDTLKSISKPVLIIHGSKDQHVLPFSTKDMQKIINQNGDNAEYHLYENVGHAPFIEDAERFNRDLAQFLK